MNEIEERIKRLEEASKSSDSEPSDSDATQRSREKVPSKNKRKLESPKSEEGKEDVHVALSFVARKCEL